MGRCGVRQSYQAKGAPPMAATLGWRKWLPVSWALVAALHSEVAAEPLVISEEHRLYDAGAVTRDDAVTPPVVTRFQFSGMGLIVWGDRRPDVTRIEAGTCEPGHVPTFEIGRAHV